MRCKPRRRLTDEASLPVPDPSSPSQQDVNGPRSPLPTTAIGDRASALEIEFATPASERARSSGASPARHTHSQRSRTGAPRRSATRSRQRSGLSATRRRRSSSRPERDACIHVGNRHRPDARFGDLLQRRASPIVRSLSPKSERRRESGSRPVRVSTRGARSWANSQAG
jgi:hypothetical protein